MVIKVTNLSSSPNAVVSGLFFGGKPTIQAATATFLGTDTTTEGSWRGVYGADGYDIAADTSATNPKLPSYATLGITGASTYTWTDEHDRSAAPCRTPPTPAGSPPPGTPRPR